MLNFNFIEKESGTSFSITFCVYFFKKNVPQIILLTDEILLQLFVSQVVMS